MCKEKIGFNVGCLAKPDRSLFDVLKEGVRVGFKTVELVSFDGARHFPGYWFHETSKKERSKLKAAIGDYAQTSIHAPFNAVGNSLFTIDEKIREISVGRIKEALDEACFLASEIVVVHPNHKWPLREEEYWDEMVNTFRNLGEYASGKGVKLGIENINIPSSYKRFPDLINEINHEMVGATIDVGHFTFNTEIKFSQEKTPILNRAIKETISSLSDKVFSLHLHDVVEQGADLQDHREAGKGIIDFGELFRCLNKNDFDGLLIFEIFGENNNEKSTLRSKRYIEYLLNQIY